MKLRAVIVDDEPLARQLIGELLAADPDVEVVAECASGAEALEVLPRLKPDLLFLDVQMPGLSGFDVLSRLPGGTDVPYVIFVTAHDRYALRAFELHALDYLLKPFARQRFEQSVARAKDAIRNQDLSELARKISSLASSVAGGPASVNHGTSTHRTEFRVHSGNVLHNVKVSEIHWIEAADQYVRLHTGETSHLLSQSLSSLEKDLDPQEFFRIHRSTMVNRAFVREIRTEKNGTHSVILTDGKRLRLSRARRKLLTDLL